MTLPDRASVIVSELGSEMRCTWIQLHCLCRARTRKVKQGMRESEMAALAAHLFPSGAMGKATKKRRSSRAPAMHAGEPPAQK
eukprot:scaffold124812_cov21-Tisochrysis_lutea.AAC.3